MRAPLYHATLNSGTARNYLQAIRKMKFSQHPSLDYIAATLVSSEDRHQAHEKLRPVVNELCGDRDFLYDMLRECLSCPKFLHQVCCLKFPLFQYGDIFIAINLFVPIRDDAAAITHDNIHHHGWRLLTTGVISGAGYEAIEFVRRSHENRTGDQVNLEVESIHRHISGKVRFVDTHTAHVVFHPSSLCSTLAIWMRMRKSSTRALRDDSLSSPEFAALPSKRSTRLD